MLSFIAAIACLAQSANAGLIWDASGAGGAAPTDGSGSWTAPNHWSDGTNNVSWSDSNDAIIGQGGVGGTLDLGGGTILVKSLGFSNVISTGYSLTNGTVSLASGGTVTASSTATPTIGLLNLPGAGTIRFSNRSLNISGLSGSGDLSLAGAGTWNVGVTLRGANSNYTGKVVNNGGWLSLTADTALGPVPASMVADALTLKGSAAVSNPGSQQPLSLATNRGITLNSSGNCLFYNNGAAFVMNLNSPITGAASTITFRQGSMNLNAVNTYAGISALDVVQLALGTDNVLPHGAGKGDLRFADWDGVSTLDLNGHTLTINALRSQSATGNFTSSAIDNKASDLATLVVGDGNASNPGNEPYVGVIRNTGGALTLVKIGTGSQTLSGTSTYSGGTIISNGVLQVGGPNALPNNGSISVLGGTLSLSNFNVAASTVTLANSGSIVGSGGILSASEFRVKSGTNKVTFAGLAASLTKDTPGTAVLGSACVYAGGTFVNQGTLRVTGQVSPDSGTGSGPVHVNAGGTLCGNGRIAGPVTVADATSAVLYPNSSGVLTIGGDLTLGRNSSLAFDLCSNALDASNDKVVLENRTLFGNNAVITIRAAGALDTANDYVLLDTGVSGTIAGGFSPTPVWAGTPPAYSSRYSVIVSGSQVRLHFDSTAVKYLLDFGGVRDSTEWYLVGALQGLVNRDAPRLFLSNNEGSQTPGAGNQWAQYLQDQKGYQWVRLRSLAEAVNTFKSMKGTNGQSLIRGLVKYQPITWNYASNTWNDTYYQYCIAANYAAQENLLPVTGVLLANNTGMLNGSSFWYTDSTMRGWAGMFASATLDAAGLHITASSDPFRDAALGSYYFKWVNVDLNVTPKIEITVSGLSSGGQWSVAINLGSNVNLNDNGGVVPIFTNMTTTGVFTCDLKNSGLFNPLTGRAGLQLCPLTTNTTVTFSRVRFLDANGNVPPALFYTPPTNGFAGLNILRDLTDVNAYPQLTDEATACAWSVQNQLPLCNSNAVMFAQNGYWVLNQLDEAIANKTFIFYQDLTPFWDPTPNFDAVMAYLTGMPRISGALPSEDLMIAYFAKYGARQVAPAENFSFWERVPAEGVKLPQARQVARLEPKYYVNFTQASGDVVAQPAGFFCGWWFAPARAQIPNAWGLNAALAEMAPAFVEYFARTAGPLDSFFVGPCGAGYAHPADMTAGQLAAFAHATRADIQTLGASPAVDWTPGLTAFTQTATDSSQAVGLFTPLRRSNGAAFNDWMEDGTPLIYPDQTLFSLWDGDPYHTTSTDLANRIKAVAAAHPQAEPYFITCNVRFSPAFYQQTLAQLNPDQFQCVGMPDFIALAQEAGGFTVKALASKVGAGDTLQVSIELHNADGTVGRAGAIKWVLPPGWTAAETQWNHGSVPQGGVLKHIVTFTAPQGLRNGSVASLVFTDDRVSWARRVSVATCAQGRTITDCASTNGWLPSSGASITLTNLVGLSNGIVHLTPALVQRRSDRLAGSKPLTNGRAAYPLGQVDFSRHPVLEVNLAGQNSFNTIIGVLNGSGVYKQLTSVQEAGVYAVDLAALTGWAGMQPLSLALDPCSSWGSFVDVQGVRLYYDGAAPFLPAPVQNQDVGAVSVSGSSSFANATYTVQGAGTDISGTADSFQFAYQTLTGDGTIIARVASQQNTAGSAKAGVMMRESLAAGAREASIVVTPASGLLFQWRSATSGSTSVSSIAGCAAPYWVKLVRAGNAFTAYGSANGSTWTQVGASQTLTMGTTIYVGLAVCALSSSTLNSSTFDNVSLPGSQAASLAPANLTAVAGSRLVTVAWNASLWATGYNIKRATSSGGPYTLVATNCNNLSFVDATVANGISYYYVISALNGSGTESANSGEVSAMPSDIPAVPTGLSAAAGNAQLGLSWNPVPGALGYNLKRATSSGGPYLAVGQYLSVTNFLDTDLNNGSNYYYVVSALNGNGESPNSAEVCATPAQVSLLPPLLKALGDGDFLQLSWPVDHTGWRLQIQTNGLTAGSWTTIAGSENTNSKTVRMTYPPGSSVFYRLVYP